MNDCGANLRLVDASETSPAPSGAEGRSEVQARALAEGLSALPPVARTWLTLATLGAALPLTSVATLAGLAAARPRSKRRSRFAKKARATGMTVLLTGGKMTKALHLARAFSAAGHRVLLTESVSYPVVSHRYSRAVDRFFVVPDVRREPIAYRTALADIIEREGVDVFVPVASPASARIEASLAAHEVEGCRVFQASPSLTERLDDKVQFCRLAEDLGLSAPTVIPVESPEAVLDFDFRSYPHPFILKSVRYDPVHRLQQLRLPSPGVEHHVRRLPIRSDNPWVLQEFLVGDEYCTHSVVHEGRIVAHVCCASSDFQVNYRSVDHPRIEAWVQHFVAALNLTGQVSFDFIESPDGEVKPVECNPRTHSAVTAFDEPEALARAYLGPKDGETLRPRQDAKPTYWLAHEVFRLGRAKSWAEARARMAVMLGGRDAVFDATDPLPFLVLHHGQIPWLLLENLLRGRDWHRIDFNIGKLVEAEGD